ncbi:hypothetical protein CBOM_07550 [Ceraceosorus bombacis]|uniref:Uncharacterized protein n=1 Tax=Ceraceosorus bombacis TaxID=401625 RepID=A0A0N7L9R8_9BASI|nr:hypothetical protein CBOM_07550 [Ceraceosorus bombacis]
MRATFSELGACTIYLTILPRKINVYTQSLDDSFSYVEALWNDCQSVWYDALLQVRWNTLIGH